MCVAENIRGLSVGSKECSNSAVGNNQVLSTSVERREARRERERTSVGAHC